MKFVGQLVCQMSYIYTYILCVCTYPAFVAIFCRLTISVSGHDSSKGMNKKLLVDGATQHIGLLTAKQGIVKVLNLKCLVASAYGFF